MRLKTIEPGMVIHCKNGEEKKALLKEAERLGYVWYHDKKKPTEKPIDLICNTIHFYDAGKTYFSADYKHITHSGQIGEDAIEFSDLILPELTEKEAIEWMAKHLFDEEFKKVFGFDYLMEGALSSMTSEEMIERIVEWKSDHEKKEPEIETVDICRIIEIQQDGRKRCVHEETIKKPITLEVEETLKRYCMEHDGEFIAVHEVVSRVKVVE